MEEKYPSESWIHIYTDGLAKDAVKRGDAGVHISFPNGKTQDEAISSKHCSNYKAEVDAIVILSDALSVLQALNAGKLQQLEKALLHLNTLRTVIQWIPSHCGVEGNEKADSLAKTGAEQEQENNPVSLKEMNTIIKSIFKPFISPFDKDRTSDHLQT